MLSTSEIRSGQIETGTLECIVCAKAYPVVRHIPRFVPSDNYATSFGLQWSAHRRTQYDEVTGVNVSERRFFISTRWPRHLQGEIIIEPGSGAGRFTRHAADTGATVLSLDFSGAVDANYSSNGDRDNVLIVQGDIYALPFPENYADKIFCFGVLQHTPDPRRAFLALPKHLKPGGQIAVDVYVKSLRRYVLGTKYWVRPFTRRVPPERLYPLVRRYVDLMWPVARALRRIPRIGKPINWRLLIADYSHIISNDATLREWAYLDTFDMLSPRYDFPQTARTLRRWFAEAGLSDIEVGRGDTGHGLEGRGVRPAATQPERVP